MSHFKLRFPAMILSTSSLLIASAALAQPAAATTGREGGGQGVICIDRCMTLAEAGLRVVGAPVEGQRQTTKVPAISAALYKQYVQLIENSGLEVLKLMAIPPAEAVNDFEPVVVVDPVKYDRIQKEYLELMSDSGFPSAGFQLSAISDAERTYLLPAFLDSRANDRTRVLTMAHEWAWRLYFRSPELQRRIPRKEMLRRILAFDSSLLKFASGDKSEAINLAVLLKPFDQEQLRYMQSVLQAYAVAQGGAGVYGSRTIRLSDDLAAQILSAPPFSSGSGFGYTLPAYDRKPDYQSIEFWNLVNQEHPQLAQLLDVGGADKLTVVGHFTRFYERRGLKFYTSDDPGRHGRFEQAFCTDRGAGRFLYVYYSNDETNALLMNCPTNIQDLETKWATEVGLRFKWQPPQAKP